MHTVDTVVIVWTMVNAMTATFIAAMVGTRIRNYRSLGRVRDARMSRNEKLTMSERHEYEYRRHLAIQDIRRSAVRFMTNGVGLIIGGWIVWIQAADHPEYIATFSRWFPYLLISMVSFILLNEVWDRASLQALRRMYNTHKEEREQLLQSRLMLYMQEHDGDVTGFVDTMDEDFS